MARSQRGRGTGAIRKLPSGRWQARVLQNGTYVALGSFIQKADANAQPTGRSRTPRRRDLGGSALRAGRFWLPTPTTGSPVGTTWRCGPSRTTRICSVCTSGRRLGPHRCLTFQPSPSAAGGTRASGPDGHGRAPKTYRLLRTTLNTAVEDGLIPRNPCRIKGAGSDKTPERPTVTVEQVYAIADAITPRYRGLVILAAFTGLRFGELRALRRKRLDLQGGVVTVAPDDGNVQRDRHGASHFTRPKSRASVRTVAIPVPVLPELEAHLQLIGNLGPDSLVFPADKSADGMRPFHAEAFGRQWRKAVAKVNGLPENLRFHDLRHTGNTLAATTGASTRELMVRMGHASPRAALIYQHASADRDRAIADALAAQIIKLQK